MAKEITKKIGLDAKFDKEDGKVVRQSIKSGETVKSGQTVKFMVE